MDPCCTYVGLFSPTIPSARGSMLAEEQLAMDVQHVRAVQVPPRVGLRGLGLNPKP